MMNWKLMFILIIYLTFGILIIRFRYREENFSETTFTTYTVPSAIFSIEKSYELSSNVSVIDFNQSISQNFTCIKTKKLLNHISTIVCLHERDTDVFISGAFRDKSIWEEDGVTRILKLLLRHPYLSFIDIGANIGTYTMYAASLGRFVLSIDCFAPNIQRIQRAVQLTNVANRVVLIQNAIYSYSGQSLYLLTDVHNIGGQELDTSESLSNNDSAINDPDVVQTIKFDELLPILVSRQIRSAIMKIDIEGSESYVFESGSQIFDSIEIPYVQMEWFKVRHYRQRVKVILDFFIKRKYDPVTLSCQSLYLSEISTWPQDLCWKKRNVRNFC